MAKVGTELDSSMFMQYDEDLREIRDQAFLNNMPANEAAE